MKRYFFLLNTLLICLTWAGENFNAKAQTNLGLLGQVKYPQGVSDLWGYAANGKEYALVATRTGISIVDITDPTNPTQLHFVSGPYNIWRDIEVYDHYAYVVSEQANHALVIIDLADLPGGYVSYTRNLGIGFSKGHTIYIDENGIGYIFGGNSATHGNASHFIDIAANPTDPPYLGKYTTYIHDGFVRNDTLWACEIYAGKLRMLNVSNKTSAVSMGSKTTPNAFTHSAWPTTDGDYVYVTDEVNGAWVTAYNCSDAADIKEVDRYKHDPLVNYPPHNPYRLNDFFVVSYYKAGVTIVDCKYPYNLIETGHYDTNPLVGSGFEGVWTAHPYLPSGVVLASDMQDGLFILEPTYTQACYVEGVVKDAITNANILGATVQVVNIIGSNTTTNATGFYATGSGASGSKLIVTSKTGYISDSTYKTLTNGVLTTHNVFLSPNTNCAAPPEGLGANTITETTATVTWNAAPNAIDYSVRYRKIDETTWTTLPAPGNSLTLTALTAFTNYEFQVRSNCTGGLKSNFSGSFKFKTAEPACATPTNITITNISANTAEVNWDAVPYALSYTVAWRKINETYWKTEHVTTDTFTITNLIHKTNYEVQIRTNCSNSNGNFSTSTNFTTLDACLATPGYWVTNNTYQSAKVNWLPMGANSYTVYYRIVGDPTWLTATTSNTNITLTGLSSCKTYEYYVETVCTGLPPAATGIKNFFTLDPPAEWTPLSIFECMGTVNLNDQIKNYYDDYGTWAGVPFVSSSGQLNPDGVAPGSYTITHTTGSGASCQDVFSANITVMACGVNLKVKAFLEGAYTGSGQMRTDLLTNGLLPTKQPYNTAPWNYSGTESVTPLPANTVDWVIIELRWANDTAVVAQAKAALLLKNGDVVTTANNTTLFFDEVPPGNYFVVIRHRNHLDIITNQPIALNNTATTVNFTVANVVMGGSSQIHQFADGKHALKAGDIDGNGTITIADYNIYASQASSIMEYLPGDTNLDRNVTIADFNLYKPNSSAIGVVYIRY